MNMRSVIAQCLKYQKSTRSFSSSLGSKGDVGKPAPASGLEKTTKKKYGIAEHLVVGYTAYVGHEWVKLYKYKKALDEKRASKAVGDRVF